jgi:hypothetical protein
MNLAEPENIPTHIKARQYASTASGWVIYLVGITAIGMTITVKRRSTIHFTFGAH